MTQLPPPTCNPHVHIIVSLSIVILQVSTIDASVRPLRGGNEELGAILVLGDDFLSCGGDAILQPGDDWGRGGL